MQEQKNIEQGKRNLSFLSRMRDNPWIVSTIVLALMFIIVLFIKSSGGMTNVASSSKVSQDVLNFLNAQTGGGVTLNSIEKESGLYKITVSYQGEVVPVYATLDGKNFISGFVPLGETRNQQNSRQPTQRNQQTVIIDSTKIANAPIKGDINAPVTIVEFSDYECPFCARANNDALKQIDEQYIKTGKVKLVYMDFPLGFHPNAKSAAVAARCAGEQSKYWEMHDKLFANYQRLDKENYKTWANEIGLNAARFNTCIDSGKYDSAIEADMNYGSELGVTGTPAFFVNGIKIEGAQPFSVFKQIIDAELSK